MIMAERSSNPEPEAPACHSSEANDRVRYPLGRYYGEYNEAGVDLSLLRSFLKLTPLERLVVMESHARDTLHS